MWYNGLLSRVAVLSTTRLLMSRRQAVPLTFPRPISNSSLFCTFCTPLQKSEAHLLPLQSLPASLQKHRGWHQQRTSKIRDVETCPRSNLQTLFNSFRINTCK